MKQVRVLMFVMLSVVAVVMFGVGCELGDSAYAESGTLLIQLTEQGVSRNLFSTETGLDMDIASYKIRIIPNGLPRSASIRAKTDDIIYDMAADSSLVIEALRPGYYELEITGYNDWDADTGKVRGEAIAYLNIKEGYGRYIPFSIARGRVSRIDATEAVLVPIVDAFGNLKITIDLSAVAGSDIIHDPNVSVTIEQINDYFQHYNKTSWGDPLATAETQTLSENESSSVYDCSFTSLPVGWYRVTAMITSTAEENPDVVQLTRIGFVRVVSDYPVGIDSKEYPLTTGTFTITDTTSFVTGSLDLTISEEMDPLSITLEGAESILYANSDGYGGTVTSGDYTVTVMGASIGNSLSYRWYINGDPDDSTTTAEKSFDFAESGQYTITVEVWESNGGDYVNWGCASQEVLVVKQLAVEQSSLEIVGGSETEKTVTMTVTADGNEITGDSPYTCEWSVTGTGETVYETQQITTDTGTLTIDLEDGDYTFTVTVQEKNSIAEGEFTQEVNVSTPGFC